MRSGCYTLLASKITWPSKVSFSLFFSLNLLLAANILIFFFYQCEKILKGNFTNSKQVYIWIVSWGVCTFNEEMLHINIHISQPVWLGSTGELKLRLLHSCGTDSCVGWLNVFSAAVAVVVIFRCSGWYHQIVGPDVRGHKTNPCL